MFYHKTFKQLRISRKITHDKLSKLLDVNLSTLSRWETGKIEPPKTAIIALACILGVNINHISEYSEVDRNKDRSYFDLNSLDSRKDIPKDIKNYIHSLREENIDHQKVISRLEKQTVLLRNLPLIIYTKDSKLKYTYANNKLANLIGGLNSLGDIFGAHSYNFFGESDYLELLTLEKTAIIEGKEIIDKIITIPGTKGVRKGLVNIIPHYDETGLITEIRCSIRDITDRYQIEEDRRKLEEAVNHLNNYYIWIGHKNSPDDSDCKIIFDYKSQNNIEAEIILQTDPEKFSIPPTPDDIKWLNSNKYPKHKIHHLNIDGKSYTIKDEIYKENNNYFGISSDITENIELNKEIDILRKTLNYLPMFIWTAISKTGKLIDGKFLFVSKSVEKILGIKIESIIGSDIKSFREKILDNNSDLFSDDQKKIYIENVKKEVFPMTFDYYINYPKGKKKYLESNIFKEGNLFYGFVNELS